MPEGGLALSLRPHSVQPAAAAAPEPGLTVRGLVFEAGGRRIIDGIDLDIARGRITAVMGANGAGKSVLLRLMHGLLTPSAGEVCCEGRPLDEAARRRQAMVFQRPVLLRRSVAANIRFVLRLRGLGRGREGAILKTAGLDHLGRTPARALSGGEQQRLALARALALEPQVLLLDEPTAHLDPASTAAIETLVRQANSDGVTVVLVTHDIGQARRLADDVAFLHRGRLAEQAPAARFFTGPASQPGRAYLEGRLLL